MDKFKHMDVADACRALLVDTFPGSTASGWKWKSTEEKDGVTVREFELQGRVSISAAVVYNPLATQEKYALFVDTSGNYDINKYDKEKFTHKEPTQKQAEEKLMSHVIPKKLTKEERKELKKKLKEEQKAFKEAQKKAPKLTKEEKEKLDKMSEDIMTDHNLGVLNTQIIFKKEAVDKDKDHILEKLESLGVMHVVEEISQKLVRGSEEFSAINSKPQEPITTLAVECMAEDMTVIRMAIGEYIAAIYRKM